jgi:hypothetical protein
MSNLSDKFRKELDVSNSRFTDALREVGFQSGEMVNVLVTAEVSKSGREAARAILLDRGLESVHERVRGILRKRYELESRSGDFPFDEAVLVELNAWSMNNVWLTGPVIEGGITISVGVCRARLP